MGESDEKICAITAAMSSGTGLDDFASTYSDRFFDVGIAEEHAATFAAGLAASGYKPVFAVYSTFLQRSYDQMIHDVALQELPVTFCIDRAGFNNADGATHHGIFDVAFISQINGIKIYTPATYDVLKRSLYEAINSNSPCAIRYPSGSEEAIIRDTFYKDSQFDSIGIRCDFDGEVDVLIVTHGRIAKECIKAKSSLAERGIRAGIVLCEYVAPYGELAELVGNVVNASEPSAILFVEEEIKAGGFGMLLSEQMRKQGMLADIQYDIMGAENAFIKCKTGQTYIEASGLDGDSIAKTALGLAHAYKELKI
jgi:1-deoxy-D-xylulose-5-phosphate synthase